MILSNQVLEFQNTIQKLTARDIATLWWLYQRICAQRTEQLNKEFGIRM